MLFVNMVCLTVGLATSIAAVPHRIYVDTR
jgi:hypothetical protein